MMLPSYLGLKRPVNRNHSSYAELEKRSGFHHCDQVAGSVCLLTLKIR